MLQSRDISCCRLMIFRFSFRRDRFVRVVRRSLGSEPQVTTRVPPVFPLSLRARRFEMNARCVHVVSSTPSSSRSPSPPEIRTAIIAQVSRPRGVLKPSRTFSPGLGGTSLYRRVISSSPPPPPPSGGVSCAAALSSMLGGILSTLTSIRLGGAPRSASSGDCFVCIAPIIYSGP